MKCKFCQAEMEEDIRICPVCGGDNTQEELRENEPETTDMAEETTEIEEEMVPETVESDAGDPVSETRTGETAVPQKKMTAGKLAAIYAGVLVLAAMLVALVLHGMRNDGKSHLYDNQGKTDTTQGTTPQNGNPEDVSCLGTYTVSDKKARKQADKVISTVGEAELTNGELQIFYWMQVYNFMNNYSASSYGIDYTVPLDQQICSLSEEGWTWQQYFLNAALGDWQLYYALCQEAERNHFTGEQDVADYVEQVRTSLEESAASAGQSGADEMIRADMGAGASLESYLHYVELTQKGYAYYSHAVDGLVPDENKIRAFYEENLELFESSGSTDDGSVFVDVRHILIAPTDEDGSKSDTDEAWERAEQQAEDVLAQWLAGEQTEESFAALVPTYSGDPGSVSNGGLYQYVQEGDMAEAFNNWCFEDSRTYGDYGIVKTSYGYHIMFFVKSQPIWQAYAQDGAQSQMISEMLTALTEQYPAQTDYSRIVLGFVDQTAGS